MVTFDPLDHGLFFIANSPPTITMTAGSFAKNYLFWGKDGSLIAIYNDHSEPQLAFERKPSHKLSPLERAQQSRAAKSDLLKRMRR